MQQVSAKAAFYAGSFDPLTNGHLSVIGKAIESFDRIVIAIGYNPNKTHFLPVDIRLDLIKKAIAAADNLTPEQKSKIAVTSFSDIYQVSAAVAHGCGSLIRGMRNTKDFEEENLLATVNESLCEDLGLPRLQTHLFNAEADKVGVSSSMVKTMIGFEGWEAAVKRYVPPVVLEALVKNHAAKQA
ncbi:MAG TPA: pantetheine-phosphate adenylyltransferase [Alphaproteobacteria bacterium]